MALKLDTTKSFWSLFAWLGTILGFAAALRVEYIGETLHSLLIPANPAGQFFVIPLLIFMVSFCGYASRIVSNALLERDRNDEGFWHRHYLWRWFLSILASLIPAAPPLLAAVYLLKPLIFALAITPILFSLCCVGLLFAVWETASAMKDLAAYTQDESASSAVGFSLFLRCFAGLALLSFGLIALIHPATAGGFMTIWLVCSTVSLLGRLIPMISNFFEEVPQLPAEDPDPKRLKSKGMEPMRRAAEPLRTKGLNDESKLPRSGALEETRDPDVNLVAAP